MPIFPGNVVADDDAGQLPDRLEIPLQRSACRFRRACANCRWRTMRQSPGRNIPVEVAECAVDDRRTPYSADFCHTSRIFGKDRRIGRQMCRDGRFASKIIACFRSGPARTGFSASDAQRVPAAWNVFHRMPRRAVCPLCGRAIPE